MKTRVAAMENDNNNNSREVGRKKDMMYTMGCMDRTVRVTGRQCIYIYICVCVCVYVCVYIRYGENLKVILYVDKMMGMLRLWE